MDGLHHLPEANAQATVWFGEAPVSPQACAEAEKLSPGHCDLFHATDEAYFKDVYYWNTPTAECLDGRGPDLQGLLRMDEGLDGDQGLSPDRELELDPGARLGAGVDSYQTTDRMPDLTRSPRHDATARPRRASPSQRRVGWRPRSIAVRAPSSALLLAAPLGWLVIAYLGSLVLLFVSAFWRLDPFTGNIVTEPTLQNFEELLTTPIYRTIAVRTIVIAAAVTVTDIVLAFPIAYYMARVASPRTRALLVVSILLPLWSGYLVKVYAWRLILAEDGLLNWILAPFGLQGPGYGDVAVWLVVSYLWLPYMIIPIFAGLERIPNSLLEASGDLGAPRLRRRSGGSSCRWSSRPSSPARSSRSR